MPVQLVGHDMMLNRQAKLSLRAAVLRARAGLAGFLGVVLGAILQILDVAVGASVGLDGFLAVRGQLGLPVGLARLVLVQKVGLVLVDLGVGVLAGALLVRQVGSGDKGSALHDLTTSGKGGSSQGSGTRENS